MPPKKLEPLATQVHLWRLSLIQPDDVIERLRYTLSCDEIERAARFRFAEHKRKFIIARGALRTILGEYLDLPARALNFRYGVLGKPELSLSPDTKLQFNLSHSREKGIVALTYERRIGVDIEYIDQQSKTAALAAKFFSATEVRLLEQFEPARRNIAFYHTWVRKEAYLKALGQGLSIPLHTFSVSVDPGSCAFLTHVSNEIDPEPVKWEIHALDVHHDYAGALLVNDFGLELKYFNWPPKHYSCF